MTQFPKPEKPSPFRVLLVDDHPEDASQTKKLLSELPGQPFELTWVSRFEDAFSVLRAGGWSACLLNHRPGAGEGLDLLRAVTAESGGTPVILFTQHADPQLDVLAMQEGAADSIAKDELTPRMLERTIRHAIERQRLQQETQWELRERQRAEAAVRSIIAKARCLLWEAEVEDDGAEVLRWRMRFFDQDAAEEFLRLDVSGAPSFPHAWLRSRLPEDRVRTDAHGDDRIRRGESYTQEFRYYTVDGEIRWLREDVKVEVVAPDRWRLVGVCTDVTERRRAEEARRESHAILTGVAEGTTDAVFVKNLEGRYIMINSAGARFIGRPAEEIVGRHDTELFSPDTVQDVLRSDQAVFRTGRTDSFEETLTAAGVTRTYLATKGPLVDPEGEIIGLIGISRDITDRKRAELALRESEARFRAMTESAPVGIYLSDVSGGNVYSNPALQQQTGRSSEELAGDKWTSMVHPDDRALAAEAWRAALDNGSSYDVTFRCVRPDGTLVWIHTRAAAVRDGDELLGYVGLTVDITARREAEQALRESEARYRFQAHLLGSIGQAVIATSLDGTIFYWNRAAEQLYGWSAEEACGAGIAMLVPASGIARAEEVLAGLFQGETLSGEFMVQRRDGVCFPALVTNTPIYDEAGKLTAVLGISSDISERKAAETALRESEARFHAIFDQAAIAMARVDIHGCILEANSALVRMLGYASEELRNRNVAEITHPDDMAEDQRLYQEMMEGNRECYQLEKRFRHKDGRDVWGHLTASLVRGAEGQPLFVIGMVEDVSERKELQERFRQAQRMEAVGQLAGGVAHDFNNMLAVITGYSEIMMGSLGADSPLRAYVDEISKAGDRAAGLTKQLLAFSRKQLLESKVFDLNATVHGMDKMLRRLIGEDIELVTLADVGLLKIKADPSQIEQVVMNLAINGRDAMPVGGILSIHTSNVWIDLANPAHPELPPGHYVSLQVRDTGCGIGPEVLPRIFEPFFTTKEVGKGTGLGLATVYGIVRQSGGSITVESAPGHGTTFTVLLPAVPSDAQKADEPQPMALPQGTETILLTEDDPMVRGMVQILLTQCGYQVLEAMQGEEALRIAEAYEGPIHLLLTDVVMPIMSGRELAQALREVRPETPVLYMSGYTDDAMLRHGVTDAGVELIQKPFSPLALMERVRRLLDAAWARPSKGTVLLVDDDAMERESLGEVLREEGYEVAEAGDGQAAFALLRDGLRPSVIILDLMMPGMNGWVFRLEQRHTPELAEIPVVVISGEFDPKGVEEYLHPAAALSKPLEVHELLTVLARYSLAATAQK